MRRLLGRLVALIEDRLLLLEDADDGVGLDEQLLEIAGERHVAHPVGTHALHRLLGEEADELLVAGVALHALELGTENVRRIFKPDDQIGDIGFHRLLLLEDVLDAGVFDVEIDVAELGVRLGELLEDDA
ncbi:hypothetical protein ABIA13_001149 [Sinorhizobium fredii]